MEPPGPSQLDTEAEDPVPHPITLQDVRNYLEAAEEEEQAIIRAELTPDNWEATMQVAMLPGRRSFPSQTPPPLGCQPTLMVVLPKNTRLYTSGYWIHSPVGTKEVIPVCVVADLDRPWTMNLVNP